MGVLFGLLAALCWGLADFAVTVVSRRSTALQTTIFMHVGSVVYAGALVGATAALDGVSGGDLWPFALLGLLGCVAYAVFFRALNLGPVSIVSPIVSGYSAITVILAVVILEERPDSLQWVAIAVVLAGVGLSATDVRELARSGLGALRSPGILLAVLAMIGLGGYVFGIAYYSDEFGWLAPIFLIRVFSTALFLGWSGAARYRLFVHVTLPLLVAMFGIGLVETSGYITFSLGVRNAETSIVATIASAYALVPIALGYLVLAERPVRNQWAGIVLVLTGLVLLGTTA